MMYRMAFVVIGGVLYATAAMAQSASPDTQAFTTTGSATFSTFAMPPWYSYEPKNDITAHELALVINLLLPALSCRHYFDDCGVVKSIDDAPPEVKRHFVKHEN